MRLFEADCNFIWFKKLTVIISKFALSQNRKNFKINFLKNQKRDCNLVSLLIVDYSFFLKPLSGAGVSVKRPCPFVFHWMWRRLQFAYCSGFHFFGLCPDVYFYPRTHLSTAQRHLVSENAHRPHQVTPRISLTCQLHLQKNGRDWEQTWPVLLQPIQNPYFSRVPYFAGTVPCGTPSLRCRDLRGTKSCWCTYTGFHGEFSNYGNTRNIYFFIRERTRSTLATRYASVYRIFTTT